MIRLRIISATAAAMTFALPLVAQAQGLDRLIIVATDLINFALAILIGIAIIAFFWGLLRYLLSAKGGPEQKKASMLMVWGLVAIFVMLSIFGIVRLMQVTFGLDGASSVDAPAIGQATSASCSKMTENFACFASWIAGLFGTATALLVGAALALYFWSIAYNLFGYTAAGSAASMQKLRGTILWGLLALFIMFSIWGIIRVLGNTLFGSNNFNSLL